MFKDAKTRNLVSNNALEEERTYYNIATNRSTTLLPILPLDLNYLSGCMGSISARVFVSTRTPMSLQCDSQLSRHSLNVSYQHRMNR